MTQQPETTEPAGLTTLQAEIARKICDLIRDGRWSPGDRLSDAGLARELQVSRTPVRQVLSFLATQGLVDAASGRGFQLLSGLEAHEDLDMLFPPSETENLYRRLMIARANGQVGDDASEAELAAQFDTSRGALRRALMRFAAEGLAERRSGHGWHFAECLNSPDVINESYAFRVIIECNAILEDGFVADPAQLDALITEQRRLLELPIAQMDASEWFEANANFHETVVSWSGNRFLVQSIHRQNSLRRMTEFAEFSQLSEAAVRKAATDHIAILEAIQGNDRKFAAAILHRHLSRTARTPPP